MKLPFLPFSPTDPLKRADGGGGMGGGGGENGGEGKVVCSLAARQPYKEMSIKTSAFLKSNILQKHNADDTLESHASMLYYRAMSGPNRPGSVCPCISVFIHLPLRVTSSMQPLKGSITGMSQTEDSEEPPTNSVPKELIIFGRNAEAVSPSTIIVTLQNETHNQTPHLLKHLCFAH